MYLRYKNGEVIVTAPFLTSKKTIDQFVASHKEWIESQKIKDSKSYLKDGDCIHFVDGDYILKVNPLIKQISLKDGLISVRNQKDFEKLLKKASKELLTNMFLNVQNQLGLKDMHLKIGIYSSQWGSCNKAKRDIHLNAYLLLTDYDFIHSVIIHEFAHMYVQNHSKDFYNVVYRWMPEYDQVHQRYKNFRFPRLEQ